MMTSVLESFKNAVIQNDLEQLQDILNNESCNFDINQIIDSGSTALHVAVKNGEKRMVDLLIKNGANVHSKANSADTCLHLAARSGSIELVDLFLRHVDIDAPNDDGCTPLHEAIKNSKGEVAELLIKNNAEVNAKDAKGCTPLHSAVKSKNFFVVELLLIHGAQPNAQGEDADSPFLLSFDYFPFDNDVFNLFMNYNVSVNLKGSVYGKNAFHCACLDGTPEAMEKLLPMGVDVNEPSFYNFAPLHLAILSAKFNLEKVKFLVDHGADVDATDIDGSTPLYMAVTRQEASIVEFLLDAGADPSDNELVYAAVRADDFETMKLLTSHGATIDFNDEWLLSYSVVARSIGFVDFFIANDAAHNPSSYEGRKTLVKALEAGLCDFVRYSLERGADVNSRCKSSSDDLGDVLPLKRAVESYRSSQRAGISETVVCLVKHIALLVAKRERVDSENMEIIESEDWILNVYNGFSEEIDKMKKTKVCLDSTATYFDVLVKPSNTLAYLLRCERLNSDLKMGFHKKSFQHYTDRIEAQYEKSYRFLRKMSAFRSVLEQTLGLIFPNGDVLDRISEFYNDEDFGICVQSSPIERKEFEQL